MTSYGAVQWSQTASLNTTADVNVYVKTGMAPSAVNDQFRSIMQSFSKFRDDNNGTLTTSGSTTAATLATNEVFTALKAGLTVTFRVAATLAASATLNVDGLGAFNLTLQTATNITTGQIAGGTIVSATYLSSTTSGLPATWRVQTVIEGGVGDLMTPTGTNVVVSGGAKTPAYAVSTSTVASTEVQIDYGKGPMQIVNNLGNFVLKAPASDGYCTMGLYNAAGCGTITTSGFTVSSFTGDAVTTSSGNIYLWNLITINGVSSYMIKALQ